MGDKYFGSKAAKFFNNTKDIVFKSNVCDTFIDGVC